MYASKILDQQSPTFFDTRTSFTKDNFSRDWGVWIFSGWFKHITFTVHFISVYFPGGSEVKASASNVGDLGSIPGLGRSPREGNGNPLQYSCLENPMDWGAWWAAVHGVIKSWTRLIDFTYLLYLFLLLLYQLHIQWSDIRSQSLGTLVLDHSPVKLVMLTTLLKLLY